MRMKPGIEQLLYEAVINSSFAFLDGRVDTATSRNCALATDADEVDRFRGIITVETDNIVQLCRAAD